jgi:hypothetical protein
MDNVPSQTIRFKPLPPPTRAPEVATRAPDVATRAPNVATRAPNVATRAPDVATRAPNVATRAPKVVSFSRRTDGIANRPLLDGFLKAIDNRGIYEYPHPWFGPKKPCHYDLNKVDVITWWSKDFTNLIESWPQHDESLRRFKHHFSFAINGPEHSALEPGVATTLEQRYSQLAWFVAKCHQLGQDPNRSILVKVDPISIYRVAPAEQHPNEFGPWCDTTAHVPELCRVLKSLGLTRMHISFTQIHSFKNTTGRRLAKMASHLEIRELTTAEEQYDVYHRLLEPFVDANDITVETCTATELVKATAHQSNPVKMGACVGWRDIEVITGLRIGPKVAKPHGTGEAVRNCSCYPNRDVGAKQETCTHGCRYCMANPKQYDW